MRDRVVEIYQSLVADYPDLTIKGAKSAYTAINGNMFSFVDADGLMCVRLSKEDKEAFENAHGTGDVVQHGAIMQGYVPVPEAMLVEIETLKAVFAKGVANARKLKPKPTKKKK